MIKTVKVLLLSWFLSGVFSHAATPPNIIFIFADDWGYGDLGIHGSSFCDTPHLDRMAKEGCDFANFTVNSPVCTPSRVAVITGQFPARHCIHQHFQSIKAHIKRGMPDWLDSEAPMLPRMLKEAGYTTGHFGKWHLGSVKDSFTWPSLEMRDGKWKLLFNREIKKMELYDLSEDWSEASDVSADNPEVVQRLKRKLNEWKKSLPTKPDPRALSRQRQK